MQVKALHVNCLFSRVIAASLLSGLWPLAVMSFTPRMGLSCFMCAKCRSRLRKKHPANYSKRTEPFTASKDVAFPYSESACLSPCCSVISHHPFGVMHAGNRLNPTRCRTILWTRDNSRCQLIGCTIGARSEKQQESGFSPSHVRGLPAATAFKAHILKIQSNLIKYRLDIIQSLDVCQSSNEHVSFVLTAKPV